MTIANVNAEDELANVQMIHRRYQQYLKPSIANKSHISQAIKSYPLAHKTGAQVSFYLPTAFILR